ncbi:CAP domain-containing protein [Actinoplanes regularis]|uniref:CAP domain-containing protein n=1 Tax=Actinoplanes regularis TaxID=52697 RepID=UPI0024A43EC0|nr:CAP domain-containing protein [Actinoplanes regularis]GLW34440.1 hypothetical protein Areg01_73770 [Actinoplanes regularis]
MSLSAAVRLRYKLAAGSTAVVLGAGLIVTGLGQQAAAESGGPADVPLAATVPGSALPVDEEGVQSPSPSHTATPSRKPSSSPAVRKTPKPASTTKKAASVSGTGSPVTGVVDALLKHINAARADEGLPALKLDTELSRASTLHNQRMIDGCGLSHQCDGEAGIGDRFIGVEFRTAGENIGFGSSKAGAAAMIEAANGLTDSMLAEVAPNDGHRKNLLNEDFTRIGLSVIRDSQGRTWMTQDFVG